jgi:hypothetical protein
MTARSTTTSKTKQERLKIRNARIRSEFEHLTQKKHLNSNYVVDNILTDKYLPLEPSTIWLIVQRQGKYKD